MKFVKQKVTTATGKYFSHPVRAFEASTLNKIADTVEMEEIPPEMIINWDQTGVKTVPSNTRTMEKQGTK